MHEGLAGNNTNCIIRKEEKKELETGKKVFACINFENKLYRIV
jgi:hypothetical protein